jgi:hypothetical protein
MMLTLNDEEHATLTQVLERALRDLRVEINHTDDRAFKTLLQERGRVLRGIFARLGGDPSGL